MCIRSSNIILIGDKIVVPLGKGSSQTYNCIVRIVVMYMHPDVSLLNSSMNYIHVEENNGCTFHFTQVKSLCVHACLTSFLYWWSVTVSCQNVKKIPHRVLCNNQNPCLDMLPIVVYVSQATQFLPLAHFLINTFQEQHNYIHIHVPLCQPGLCILSHGKDFVGLHVYNPIITAFHYQGHPIESGCGTPYCSSSIE